MGVVIVSIWPVPHDTAAIDSPAHRRRALGVGLALAALVTTVGPIPAKKEWIRAGRVTPTASLASAESVPNNRHVHEIRSRAGEARRR